MPIQDDRNWKRSDIPELFWSGDGVREQLSVRLLRDLSAPPNEFKTSNKPLVEVSERIHALPIHTGSWYTLIVWVDGNLLKKAPYSYWDKSSDSDKLPAIQLIQKISESSNEFILYTSKSFTVSEEGDVFSPYGNPENVKITGGFKLTLLDKSHTVDDVGSEPHIIVNKLSEYTMKVERTDELTSDWLSSIPLASVEENVFEFLEEKVTIPSDEQMAIDIFRNEHIESTQTVEKNGIHKPKIVRECKPLDDKKFTICEGCGLLAVHPERVTSKKVVDFGIISYEIDSNTYIQCENCRSGAIPSDMSDDFIHKYSDDLFDNDGDEEGCLSLDDLEDVNEVAVKTSDVSLSTDEKKRIFR